MIFLPAALGFVAPVVEGSGPLPMQPYDPPPGDDVQITWVGQTAYEPPIGNEIDIVWQ